MQRQLPAVSASRLASLGTAAMLLLACFRVTGFAGPRLLSPTHRESGHRYFGFDKDDYPGDDQLPALRRSFAYTGYWLNRPPGAASNSWAGKRALLKARGFGFLILFNGRLDAELKNKDAAAL